MSIKNIFTILLLLIPVTAKAGVSFTNLRIFIDNKSNKQDFMLLNRGNASENCQISLIDYNVAADGKLSALKPGEQTTTSAQPYIRISPKNVTIKAQQSQKLKVIARGYRKAKSNELHSYLSIACTEIDEPLLPTKAQDTDQYKAAGFKPTLISRIPIIIRKEQVPVTIDFKDINFTTKGDDTLLSFTLLKEGERSTYGTLELLDESSSRVAVKNSVSAYIEAKAIKHTLKFKNSNSKKFTLSYKEDPKFGGDESKSIEIKKP